MIKKETISKIPPDGEWGWMIVIAYALANMIVIPVLQGFGLIYKDKFIELGISATDASIIVNMFSAFGMSLGLINGPLLRNFGYRKVGFAAGVFFAIGLFFTSWGESFTHFIITYSIIASVGFGLSTSSFSLALNSYFRVRRNRAVGIALTLTGLGPILFPQLISVLLYHYDVQGCMMIISAISLHIIAAALLLQPIKWHMIDAPPLLPPIIEDDNEEAEELQPLAEEAKELEMIPEVLIDDSQSSLNTITNIKKLDTSLWELSDDEDDYLDYPQKRRLSIDHDADTQSIYGFEITQPIRRYPENHSSSPLTNAFQSNEMISTKNSITNSNRNLIRMRSCSPIFPPSRPLSSLTPRRRWFETGSEETVNLGSSVKIFDERPISADMSSSKRFIFPAGAQKIADEERRMVNKESPIDSPDQFYQTNIRNGKFARTISMTSTDSYRKRLSPAKMVEMKKGRKPVIVYCKRYGKRVVKFFDFNLLRDPIYINMMVGMSIAVCAEINFSLLTPFILNDLKYSTAEIASVMSALSITDIIFRFLAPFIGDFLKQTPRVLYMYSLLMLIVSRFCVYLVTSFTGMIIVGLFMGVGKGIRTVYMSLVIPNYIPIERLASASGIQMVTNGVFLMTFGPLIGVIRDYSGSYVKCIIFINLITFSTIIMWVTEMLIVKYKKRKREQQQQQQNLDSAPK